MLKDIAANGATVASGNTADFQAAVWRGKTRSDRAKLAWRQAVSGRNFAR